EAVKREAKRARCRYGESAGGFSIVEPGIIDTAMARRIENPPADSPYRQRARFASLFTASLKNPAPPSLVGQKILEIVESGTWQLRHPVGPDAVPAVAPSNDGRGVGEPECK